MPVEMKTPSGSSAGQQYDPLEDAAFTDDVGELPAGRILACAPALAPATGKYMINRWPHSVEVDRQEIACRNPHRFRIRTIFITPSEDARSSPRSGSSKEKPRSPTSSP
jgi:hypothetical protein